MKVFAQWTPIKVGEGTHFVLKLSQKWSDELPWLVFSPDLNWEDFEGVGRLNNDPTLIKSTPYKKEMFQHNSQFLSEPYEHGLNKYGFAMHSIYSIA